MLRGLKAWRVGRGPRPWVFIPRRGHASSSKGRLWCGQADADIELVRAPIPTPWKSSPPPTDTPPPSSIEREAGGIRALWLPRSPSLTVNNPRIEILSARCFVPTISILLWCASWMPQYASRSAQSGRRLQKAIRPILMRLLSCSSVAAFFFFLSLCNSTRFKGRIDKTRQTNKQTKSVC